MKAGHFLLAKLCKVKVKEFAIGFGPKIFRWNGKETKYTLRLIPLGGFVNMLGEEERSSEEGSFSKASILKRVLIVLAGGIFNIVFGIIVYFILVSSTGGYISNKIESVTLGYPAEEVGIKANDEIIKIDGKKVRLKSDFDKLIDNSNGKDFILTLKRDNKLIDINVKPAEKLEKNIGIYLGIEGQDLSSKIKTVYSNTVAEKAGIKAGDKVITVDNINVENDPMKLVELISQNTADSISISINRDNEILNLTLVPEIIKTYYLGIVFAKAENTFITNIYYGFWDTINFSTSIIDNVKLLFTGNVGVNQLMGPVGISGVISQTKGIVDFIYMVALISLSLGITNLLPFPPLDGGKIFILLIEAIRKKPLKEKIEVSIQMAGFVILILLSIYVTYNDILRVF